MSFVPEDPGVKVAVWIEDIQKNRILDTTKSIQPGDYTVKAEVTQLAVGLDPATFFSFVFHFFLCDPNGASIPGTLRYLQGGVTLNDTSEIVLGTAKVPDQLGFISYGALLFLGTEQEHGEPIYTWVDRVVPIKRE